MNISQFSVSHEKSRLQLDRIHDFLSNQAYWCLGIPKAVVEQALKHSLCFGLYENKLGIQIGFARVVTDQATFAWLCDIYVEREFRGKGLSKMLMSEMMKHPSLKKLRRMCLTTKDGHFLYEKFGFEITKTPNYWMEIKNNEIYRKG